MPQIHVLFTPEASLKNQLLLQKKLMMLQNIGQSGQQGLFRGLPIKYLGSQIEKSKSGDIKITI